MSHHSPGGREASRLLNRVDLNKIRSPGLEVGAKRLFKTSVAAVASVEHSAACSSPGPGYGQL